MLPMFSALLYRKGRKITMKKRCLSLLLALCLLAALAVPAFAQEAGELPTLLPASEHPSVILNTPTADIPAVRAEVSPVCVPHSTMRDLSIAKGYEGYLYYSIYRGNVSGTYGYSIELYRGTSITESNYIGGYAEGYSSNDLQTLELTVGTDITSSLTAGTYTVVSAVLVAVNGEARTVSGTETKTQIQVVNNPIPLQGIYFESVKDTMYIDQDQEIETRIAFSPANTTARRNYALSLSNDTVLGGMDFGDSIILIGYQPGTTTVYAQLGSAAAGFRVTVHGYVGSLDQKSQTLHEGSSAKLSFTVSPDDGQTKAVWSSNDPQVVSVAQDGTITALREGYATVSVSLTFPDGRTGLASCGVTVTPHTGDVLSEQPATASRDGWQQINCTVCGHEATHILSRRFLDLDGTQWYADGVDDIVDRGLMNGTGPVTFEPNSTMTRAMLVTVLWRSAGSPNEGTNAFTDVPADQWYTQAVAWAAQNGIVNGVGNNKFDPDAKITREQLAAVLYRYAGKVGMDVSARADLKLFPDAGSVSAYATDALSWCVANGIVNGTLEHGTAYLDPQGSATRAQVATLMSRYLKLTEA